MKKVISLFLFAAPFCCYSQEIKVLQGELEFLRGETAIRIEFDYNFIDIAGGGTEKEYLARRIEYLNKKEPGRGDKFERNWIQFRRDYFEPKFTEAFTKYAKLSLANGDDAAYTLIFKTFQFEDYALLVPPEEEADPTNWVALMDGEAWFVETKNRDNILAKIAVTKTPGRDYDLEYSRSNTIMAQYDVRLRLSFTYKQAGEELGVYIAKFLKKQSKTKN